MLYTVTAQDKERAVLWTKEVTCTCFESAIGLAVCGARMAGVHSVLVSKV